MNDPIGNYFDHPFSIDQVQRLIAPDNIKDISKSILIKAENEFPGITLEQTAWDILTKLSVEVKAFEKAKCEEQKEKLFLTHATSLHDTFILSRDAVLIDIYNEIKEMFVKLYRDLHSDENEIFDAALEPSEAALDFVDDFYGRGPHPPNALHSEGHQDSMGVCLFLALYEKFTHGLIDLIILDDVVMSVDCNHRRALCKSLSENFQEKQLLITTHDRIWAMQLKQNGIVDSNSMYEFFNWDIELGPQVNDIVDIWSRIQKDIDNNDIPAAAAKLRRGGEQFFSEVCDNLLARVPFHIDGNYNLGDLLFPAMSQIKYLLKEAKKSEASWKGTPLDEIQVLDEKRKKIFGTVADEQWAINVNVHFNEWANFTRNDFIPVIEAFQNLFDFFTCEKCNSTLYVVLDGTELNNLRCKCDYYHWNLVKK
ncbi:MAG TPA: hypothetical protein ENK92_00145 [Bacteroidetes bacterium]|nr:hypothetical protein [Bacteroidota bacterium]